MKAPTEWRALRGWSEAELAERLAWLATAERNFTGSHGEHMVDPAWNHFGSRASIGSGPPGIPGLDGPFARGRRALETFAFSDPDIAEAHYARGAPLADRRMLLELKVMGLHYLCGVVVDAVRSETDEQSSAFGFRYETLVGHIEAGSEWFVLRSTHATGELTFTIEASWRPGDFPNAWSRYGFWVLGRRYQRTWHRRAHARMAAFVAGEAVETLARPRGRLLAHGGPQVHFTQKRGRSG